MFCYSCGKPVVEGAKFCHNCGAKVIVLPSTQSSEKDSQIDDVFNPFADQDIEITSPAPQENITNEPITFEDLPDIQVFVCTGKLIKEISFEQYTSLVEANKGNGNIDSIGKVYKNSRNTTYWEEVDKGDLSVDSSKVFFVGQDVTLSIPINDIVNVVNEEDGIFIYQAEIENPYVFVVDISKKQDFINSINLLQTGNSLDVGPSNNSSDFVPPAMQQECHQGREEDFPKDETVTTAGIKYNFVTNAIMLPPGESVLCEGEMRTWNEVNGKLIITNKSLISFEIKTKSLKVYSLKDIKRVSTSTLFTYISIDLVGSNDQVTFDMNKDHIEKMGAALDDLVNNYGKSIMQQDNTSGNTKAIAFPKDECISKYGVTYNFVNHAILLRTGEYVVCEADIRILGNIKGKLILTTQALIHFDNGTRELKMYYFREIEHADYSSFFTMLRIHIFGAKDDITYDLNKLHGPQFFEELTHFVPKKYPK